MKKKIFLGLIIVLAFMQFKSVDKTNPPIVEQQDFFARNNAPEEIKALFKNACYDCHSNETKYPWYFNVAPVSWWTRGHIDHAREEMNFSIWKTFNAKKQSHLMEECIEKISEKEMPLLSYIIAHPEARISEDERNQMATWLKSINVNKYEDDED